VTPEKELMFTEFLDKISDHSSLYDNREKTDEGENVSDLLVTGQKILFPQQD